MLSVIDISKNFGDFTAINKLSFEVKVGDVMGFLGPNGAGKTTSFYTIVGLIKPSAGEVLLDNIDITSYPMYQRAQNGIGYLAIKNSGIKQTNVK